MAGASLAFGLEAVSGSTYLQFSPSAILLMSMTKVSSTNWESVRFPPSSKEPTEPPKMKYFQDGME